MTGRIQIVRPDGGITTLPEDCRIVIGSEMVARFRAHGPVSFNRPDSAINKHLDDAINGLDAAADVTPEMLVAAQRLMLGEEGFRYEVSSVDAARIYRAMDALRPKGEK